jgi:metal-sulfur cluster biosynthetic enzyme
MTPTLHTLAPVPDPDAVLAALGEVLDPELALDILSLGLVNAVQIVGEAVTVEMTLTTPGCPLHGSIAAAVDARLTRVEGVGAVDVIVVWDPPWTPASMSDEARRALGFG